MTMQINGEELLRLNKAGQSYSALARQLGTTRGVVAGIIGRYKKGAQTLPPPEQRKIEFTEVKNEATAESIGRIKTLDALIIACKIDLTVWKIDRHTINKWEVGRKATTKNVTYTDGVASGTVTDSGEVNVEPLWQVKVWLSKRNPEPIKPVLKPINVNVKAVAHNKKRDGVNVAVILPDPQFGFSTLIERGKHTLVPFHDRLALSVAFQIVEHLNPNMVVWLGDVNDFTMFTDKFIRKPEFYFNTQPMLVEGSWAVAQTKALCDNVSVLEGNHEDRVSRMMMTHLSDAYGLKPGDMLDAPAVMSVDNLMGYSRMGVNYVDSYPDGEIWITDTVKCVHGNTVRGGAGVTSKAVANNEYVSTIYGHIHRIENATKTVRGRSGYEYVQAFSPGCLCHIDGRVPGATGSEQWQQGVGVVYYQEGYDPQFVAVPIRNGKALFDGLAFEGKDYIDQLKADTLYEF